MKTWTRGKNRKSPKRKISHNSLSSTLRLLSSATVQASTMLNSIVLMVTHSLTTTLSMIFAMTSQISPTLQLESFKNFERKLNAYIAE